MKSFITGLFFVLILSVCVFGFSPKTVNASPSAKWYIEGTVTNAKNEQVYGASVVIQCGSNAPYAATTTSKKGVYSKNYAISNCPEGATVTATASSAGLIASGKGVIRRASDDKFRVIIDIKLVDNVSVPEMGTVGMITGVLLGGGALMYSRSRTAYRKI
jgi:hypothetical protein